MRTRDRHTLLVLIGMLLLNLVTAVVSACFVWRASRRAEECLKRADAAEKASVQACASALLLSDRSPVSVDPDSGEVVPQQETVVGYGQTRSKVSLYLYRDIRGTDGVVRREFFERFPLPR